MNKLFITGGAGFIGSHVAEFYAKKDKQVVVFDNLSRSQLLKKDINSLDYNWNYLKKYKNIELIKGDITDIRQLTAASENADVIFHAAAQTAVTTSVLDPSTDFKANALGTFNVLEAARKNNVNSLLYCSTNKVYGNNVNNIEVNEGELKYSFGKEFEQGVSESFNTDLCEHTPYGCSKFAGDLYVQDYAHLYGLKAGVFRMSCIYGTRQLGVEDQGWVAWFAIATVLGKPITIYGDGKQVRDVLYISDLLELYDLFIDSKMQHGVFNTGGGPENTLSLLELLNILKDLTGKKSDISFSDWRPSDQKVYISDISKTSKELGWKPKIKPREGVKKLVDWVIKNREIF